MLQSWQPCSYFLYFSVQRLISICNHHQQLLIDKDWKNISIKRMPNGSGNNCINIMVIRKWLFTKKGRRLIFTINKAANVHLFIRQKKAA